MKLTCRNNGGKFTVHVDPDRIISARDDTRMLLVDGIIGPLRVGKGSYGRAVAYLDGKSAS